MAERGPSTGRASAPADDLAPRAAAPRRFLRARPWLVDVAVSLTFTAIVIATLASEVVTDQATVTVWDAVAIAGTAIALLFRRRAAHRAARRRAPHDGFTFSAPVDLILAVPFALYAVAAFRSPTTAGSPEGRPSR